MTKVMQEFLESPLISKAVATVAAQQHIRDSRRLAWVLELDNLFNIADAAWVYASHYHGGSDTEAYKLFSHLNAVRYRPSVGLTLTSVLAREEDYLDVLGWLIAIGKADSVEIDEATGEILKKKD